MSAVAVAQAAQVLAEIGESVNNIVDTNKRREFEFKLSLLSINQKEALDKALKQQRTQESKERLLTEILGTMNRDRINSLVATQNEREKTMRYLYIFGGVALLALVGIFVYVSKKNRK